ncbi:MAG: hypothetical protein J6Y95_05705, partial [Lachnospiraceae bacterium]|nr:hypothetical protein [Lachnospiraceae bacterium]
DSDKRVTDLRAINNHLFLTSRECIDVYDLDTGAFLWNLPAEKDDIYGTQIRGDDDYVVYHKDYYETYASYADYIKQTYEESFQFEEPLQSDSPNTDSLYTIVNYEGNAVKAIYGDTGYLHTENQSRKVPDRRFEDGIKNVILAGEEYLVTTYLRTKYDKTEFTHVFLIDKFNEIVNSYTYTVAPADYYGEVEKAIASPDGNVIYGKTRHHL